MDWDFDGSSVITPSQLYAPTDQSPREEENVRQENASPITEGFVCPECMLDCYSPTALKLHFNTLHKNLPPANATTTPPASTTHDSRNTLRSNEDEWEMVIEPGDFNESLQICNSSTASTKKPNSFSFWSNRFTKAPSSTPPPSTTHATSNSPRDNGVDHANQNKIQISASTVMLNTRETMFIADGVLRSKTKEFAQIRKTSCSGRRSHMQLIVRCEKLREVYKSNTKLEMMLHQSKLEQSVVRWQPDGYIKGKCDNCQSSLKEKGQDNCRLCGLMFCVDCLCNVNVNKFGIKTSQVIDPNESTFFSGAGVTICVGTCVSVALPLIPIDDARSTQQLTNFHNSLLKSRTEIVNLIAGKKHPSLVKAEQSNVTKLISQIGRLKFKSERNRKIQQLMVVFGKQLLVLNFTRL
eukprot:m.102814 g.102814  ORF g.102814 m.102814 type:complete len:410 (+) comp27440_c0_seq2:308-1537(+)